MTGRLEIVPALAGHIRPIARRMRQADRDEIAASSGRSPGNALVYSLRNSALARTVLVDGRPEVMFGIGDVNILSGIGSPWLLGTDVIERHRTEFLRKSVSWRDQLLSRYPVMMNSVDARNKLSIRWLKWLGFSLSEPVLVRGHAFHIFELRSPDV